MQCDRVRACTVRLAHCLSAVEFCRVDGPCRVRDFSAFRSLASFKQISRRQTKGFERLSSIAAILLKVQPGRPGLESSERDLWIEEVVIDAPVEGRRSLAYSLTS